MNKLWFRKMIWSYIPLFLVVFSFLIFVFLQAIVEQNRENAKSSSEMFTAQLLQSVEVSLKTIDYLVIRELLDNRLFASYFEETDAGNIFLNYEVLERLNDLKQEVPLIDSFYLYRYSDGTVFSRHMRERIDQFEDRMFARSMTNKPAGPNWTDVRSYRELSFQAPKQVVSVVHEVPINSGYQGLFVINIDVAALQSTVSSLYNEPSTFVNLFDRQGQSIYTDNDRPGRQVMATLTSDYTGWTIESGMTSGLLASATSAFSSVWFVIGVLVFVSGLVFIILITRANYKPLEALVIQLNNSLLEGGGSAGSVPADEFAFIESAINNFAAQSKLAAREYGEAAILKRKQAFNDLIYGCLEQGELVGKSALEGVTPPVFQKVEAMVLEVDCPEQTFFTYSGQDRSLFKFVVSSVVHEMVQQAKLSVWLEWTSPIHLTGIVFLPDGQASIDVCEAIVEWVARNLSFTVTIGLGQASSALEEVKLSYEEAHSLLHFKAVLGNNRLIHAADIDRHGRKDEHEHLRTIQDMASAFRAGDEQWKRHYHSLVDDIRADRPAKADIVKHMDHMLAHLELLVSNSLKEEYQLMRQAFEDMRAALKTFDTLDSLHHTLYAILEACSEQLEEVRNSRSRYGMLQEVKELIEQDYANPNLSLDYLSERFAINAKYLSRLFKEAFGENFLDFLMSVRIRTAKELLLTEEHSITEIGERVGYPNAATFRRVFRKMEGLSPQEYLAACCVSAPGRIVIDRRNLSGRQEGTVL